MTSKSLVFTVALCVSFFLVFGESLEAEISNTNENNKDVSLSNKDIQHTEDREKRRVRRDTETNTQNPPSKNVKKSLDRLQKLDLELAIETTRLEELNKLKEAEQINENTPSDNLSKWQKNILSGISKTQKKKEDLTVKVEVLKTLVQKLTNGDSKSSAKGERQIKDKINKIIKALVDQNKINLELAIATTKLEELKNQKEAEKVDVATATRKLTKWQNNLLNAISKAREKKGDLTVKAAIIKTKLNQLKEQLTAAGGSPDSIPSTSSKNKQQIKNKIVKAEDNQWKINRKLALATAELEQLEKRKEAEKIQSTNTNLTKKQKKILNDIEKVKEKKYHLTLEAAVEKTLIDQLKQQLNSNEKSSSSSSSAAGKTKK